MFLSFSTVLICLKHGLSSWSQFAISPSTWLADEQGVLAVQHHPIHFTFADVVIDGHGVIGAEGVEIGHLFAITEHVIKSLAPGAF
jgi:hypothetical protein